MIEQRLQAVIASEQLDLPVLPAVATQIVQLTHDENADAAGLASLITSDPVLAGQIMRLANSAAISNGAKIQSLQQAIARLGMSAIGEMALSVSVGSKLEIKHRSASQSIQRIWKESLATACWSKELARVCRFNTEVAFLSGLMHQIGKALALHLIVQCLEGDDFPDAATVVDLSQRYYVPLNTRLADAWSMPGIVATVMSSAEQLVQPKIQHEDRNVADMLAVVKAAKLLAAMHIEDDKSFEQVTVDPIFVELNLYEEDLIGLSVKQETIGGKVDAMLL